MKVMFVSAEVSPLAKVGGLADVAGSLPKALRALGHDVRIVMPAYQMVLDDPQWGAKRIRQGVPVKINSKWQKAMDVYEVNLGGVPVYMIGTDEWFTESNRSEALYLPGGDHYLFFSVAALKLPKALGWRPDVVHCNDWHTGFVPVLMRERDPFEWAQTASVFSIHNLAYQGEFDIDVLDRLDLPRCLYNPNQLETFGTVNFLKAGMVFADQVNTVSPRYALEIQTPQYGCRLEGLMRYLDEQDRLTGVLNGIDQEMFNPATDPDLPAHFSIDDLAGKKICRTKLFEELELPEIPDTPVMGVVSRISTQKGMDLIIAAAEAVLPRAQLIVLGAGDPVIADAFHLLKRHFKDRVAFHEGFHLSLAPRIYAGCDMFLMPSAFEPCGLGQMIAMRYGTVPIVRFTGGLADTVADEENGFVFYEKTGSAFAMAVNRAIDAFHRPDDWSALVHACMAADHSWSISAHEYEKIYERALASLDCGAATGIAVRG